MCAIIHGKKVHECVKISNRFIMMFMWCIEIETLSTIPGIYIPHTAQCQASCIDIWYASMLYANARLKSSNLFNCFRSFICCVHESIFLPKYVSVNISIIALSQMCTDSFEWNFNFKILLCLTQDSLVQSSVNSVFEDVQKNKKNKKTTNNDRGFKNVLNIYTAFIELMMMMCLYMCLCAFFSQESISKCRQMWQKWWEEEKHEI